MARGGARVGAGRPKGAPNKFSEAARATAAKAGITPLEYMLSVLRDKANAPETRMDAAKAAAPYMHARLESVKHSGDPESPVEIIRIERVILDSADPNPADIPAAT
jgi:hypothetical protein